MSNSPVPISFGTQADTGRYSADGGPEHLNCYIQSVNEGKHPYPIYAAGGFSLLTSVTNANDCRGIAQFSDTIAYALMGSAVVKLEYDGSSTFFTIIGGITTLDRAIMAVNQKSGGRQVAIVTGGLKYSIEGDNLLEITDADLPTPISVTFLNQRVIYAIEDGRHYYSDVDDVRSVGSSSFFSSEGDNDDNVRGIAHKQEYWAFGKKSIEVWRDTGASTAPYRRNTSVNIQKGCAARDSVASLDEDIFWLADDFSVYRAQGYAPMPLYHQALDEDIRKTVDKSEIRAFTYHSRGAAFYVIKSNSWTWQYNRTTNKWFKRKSHGLDFWRAECSVELSGKTIFGDYQSPNFYLLDEDVFSENGEALVMRLRSAPMHDYPNQMIIDRLYLDFILGVGLNSSNTWESNPQVGIRWSDDLGLTWSNQRFRPLGKLSDRNGRVVFQELGQTNEQGRVWEIEVSSPVVRSLSYAAVLGDKLQA
ncbi:MAG: hypothetical protein AAF228_12145 [Pseudomonadota bacterium]